MRGLFGCSLLCLMALLAPVVSAADPEVSGVKSWPLTVPSGGHPGFVLVPGDQTGIHFTNQLETEAMLANQNLLNGAGLALGDYDGDGWCDIFLCNLNGSSRLFRNLGGWKFEDVTEKVGLSNSNQLARGRSEEHTSELQSRV